MTHPPARVCQTLTSSSPVTSTQSSTKVVAASTTPQVSITATVSSISRPQATDVGWLHGLVAPVVGILGTAGRSGSTTCKTSRPCKVMVACRQPPQHQQAKESPATQMERVIKVIPSTGMMVVCQR
jgi:hypothetical protein